MKSIRSKLFLQVGGLVLFLIILLLVANNFFLKIYFVNQQKDTVVEYYEIINDLETADYLNERQLFGTLENEFNIDVVIYDATDTIVYQSRSYQTPPGVEPMIPELNVTDEEVVNDSYSFIYATDRNIHNEILMLDGVMDNGNTIQLSIPINTIERNVIIVNQFLVYIGSITFVLSMLLAYLLSNYFTDPIRKINNIAKKMKNLEFNHAIDIKSKDELGELAVTINELSHELEQTINNLSDQNVVLEKEMNENIKLSKKRRELLNNVSHELKTPLSLMQGYAEGLKLNVTSSKEKSDFYCDVIIEETIKMNQLVEALLELDQSQFGDRPQTVTNTDLSYFVTKLVSKFEKPIEDRGISLTLDIPEHVKHTFNISANERVLTNFITNAINYCDDKLKMAVRLKKQDGTYFIEVFNTSPAFKEDEIEKLWDSFYKVDISRNRETGGHGLGLSIVKAIQEKQNKEYGVKNLEQGVVFYYEV